MNQHLMAEVNFIAPGEEEGTGGESECPDSKVIRNVMSSDPKFLSS